MVKILFLGNDKRSTNAAKILNDKNIFATVLQDDKFLYDKYDVYIMPIPISANGETLNNGNVNISLSKLVQIIPQNALLLSAGKCIGNSIDIGSRDDFAYKNAIPTAEGAIALAISSTLVTLNESKILVTGFGRVSKILIQKLKGLCSNVTVALRNKSDISLINTLGIKTIPIEKIANNIQNYTIIFNSVPYKIFDRDTLSKANKNTLFIELASNEQGFDTNSIKELNIHYINAPGLPNKVAPITAAHILAETIINVLEEKNLN